MSLEEYFSFFEENSVSIQLTLDVGAQPTVHALYIKDNSNVREIKKTVADTPLQALELMKEKVIEDGVVQLH